MSNKSDTIENNLKKISYERIFTINKRIKYLKNMLENTFKETQKNPTLLDQKEINEVKFKLDREYERVFLNRMEELKIIKKSKAIKSLNKDPEFPATNFYEQLITQKVIIVFINPILQKPYYSAKKQILKGTSSYISRSKFMIKIYDNLQRLFTTKFQIFDNS